MSRNINLKKRSFAKGKNQQIEENVVDPKRHQNNK